MKFFAAVVVLLLAGCGIGGGGSASPSAAGSPTPSPLANASGKLDAQVPMPPGFPTDVPIYPGARLTAGAAFMSSGEASWGMEWETQDPVAKVQAFYADKLNRDDWTITFTTTAGDAFAATFKRKSNSRSSGTLASDSTSRVTKILMSLVSPAG